MNIDYPVTLDESHTLKPTTGPTRTARQITKADVTTGFLIVDAGGTQVHASGYDASTHNAGKGARLTNLSGAAKGHLRKWCPNCHAIKTFAEFGEARTTNEYRDQSNCTECRGNAFK